MSIVFSSANTEELNVKARIFESGKKKKTRRKTTGHSHNKKRERHRGVESPEK
jgi:hypothetical protein